VPRSRWFLLGIVARTLYRPQISWLLLPALVGLAYAAGRRELPEGLDGALFFMVCWLLLSTLFAAGAARLPQLDPLPLSRRRLFAWLVLPPLLMVFIGYLGGSALRSDPAALGYGEHPMAGGRDLRVPFAYWEVGWDGNPPAVAEPYVPPWEEPYYAPSVTLIRGLSPVLYSPYHVPAGSDRAFLARQVSRAVAAVYGKVVAPEEIEGHYLVAAAGGSVGVVPFWEQGQSPRPSVSWGTAPVVVLLVGLPWLLYVTLAVRGGYLSPSDGRRPWGHLALAALSGVSVLGTVWACSARLTTSWKLAALSQILMRKAADLLPETVPLRWGMVLVILTIAYALAAARFAGGEIPASPASSD
jgi:hypothetical protein